MTTWTKSGFVDNKNKCSVLNEFLACLCQSGSFNTELHLKKRRHRIDLERLLHFIDIDIENKISVNIVFVSNCYENPEPGDQVIFYVDNNGNIFHALDVYLVRATIHPIKHERHLSKFGQSNKVITRYNCS